MEQENKEMRQTIVYLENLCQTLTAQTASARQDAEYQTRAREVMVRELKDKIKEKEDRMLHFAYLYAKMDRGNKKLADRLNYYARENDRLEKENYWLKKDNDRLEKDFPRPLYERMCLLFGVSFGDEMTLMSVVRC